MVTCGSQHGADHTDHSTRPTQGVYCHHSGAPTEHHPRLGDCGHPQASLKPPSPPYDILLSVFFPLPSLRKFLRISYFVLMNWANETVTFIKAPDKVNKTALPASWEIRMVEKATAPMKRTLKKSTLTPIHRTLARTKENAWLCLSWCLEETKNEFSLSFFKHFRSVIFSSLLVATVFSFVLFIYFYFPWSPKELMFLLSGHRMMGSHISLRRLTAN